MYMPSMNSHGEVLRSFSYTMQCQGQGLVQLQPRVVSADPVRPYSKTYCM